LTGKKKKATQSGGGLWVSVPVHEGFGERRGSLPGHRSPDPVDAYSLVPPVAILD